MYRFGLVLAFLIFSSPAAAAPPPSPRLAGAPTTPGAEAAGPDLDIIIVIGTSNAAGRGVVPAGQVLSPWVVGLSADTGLYGVPVFRAGIAPWVYAGFYGPQAALAARWLELTGRQRVVAVATTARGGSRIAHYIEADPLGLAARRNVEQAASLGTIRGIVYVGGENEREAAHVAGWLDALEAVVWDLRAIVGHVPLVVTEVPRSRAFPVRAQQLLVPSRIPLSAVAPSLGCATGIDRTHYTAQGADCIGARAAEALAGLQ